MSKWLLLAVAVVSVGLISRGLFTLFVAFQRSVARICTHPTRTVSADVLHGDAAGFAVKWCRRCGAIQVVYAHDLDSLTRANTAAEYIRRRMQCASPAEWRLIASVEVRWMGDSLTESPGALAILASIPNVPSRFDPTAELSAFYDGEQWDPEVKAKRDAAGRPSLTLNMLPRLMAMAMEKHLATPDACKLANLDLEVLRCYIAFRNRDAQMAFNYMASVALEASAPKSDARILSPDELGKAVWLSSLQGRQSPDEWGDLMPVTRKYWIGLGRAAIDFYLKQPKVSA